jgi:hypothetical protein
VHDLTVAKNEAVRAADQQQSTVGYLKESLERETTTTAKLQADLARVDQQLKSQAPVGIDDLLPSAAWQSGEFNPELSSQIGRIIANPAFQPTSRLQHIYHAIVAYYEKLVDERNAALDSAYTENQAIATALNSFLVNLSVAAAVEPVSVSDFFAQSAGDRLVAAIGEFKRERDDFKRANDQLGSVIVQIEQIFGLAPASDLATVLQGIADVKEKADKQADTLRDRTHKCHDLSHELKALTRKADDDAAGYQAEIAQLTASVEKLTVDNENLETSKSTLNKEIHKVQNAYQVLEQETSDADRRLRETHEEELQQAQASQDAIEKQLRQEIARQNGKLDDAAQKIAQLSATVKLQKETIAAQKTTIGEKVEEFAAFAAGAEEQQRALVERTETEQRQLIVAQEKTVSELQAQSDLQRKDIQKLTANLSAAEKKLKEARTQIYELKRDAAKREKELDAQEKQLEREKKVHEATSRAITLKAESDCTARLEEYKSASESEKRKVFAFIVDSFRQYLAGSDTVDEKVVKAVVVKAKAELANLTETDTAVRRIVSAGLGQRTDDAVAQAFLKRF